MSQNVFQTENLEIENFFPRKIFFVGLGFLAKITKIVKTWQSQKNFFEKCFSVGIDSECSKTDFKLKISKSKVFSHVKFFSWDFVFFGKMT